METTLTVFRAEASLGTATSVVICPGGAFHLLAIDHEGFHAARCLAARGVTCFVLKYRLVECQSDDPHQELAALLPNQDRLDRLNGPIAALAVADGLAAMRYVRLNAEKWSLDPLRVGIMGFSAGGTIAAAVA